MSLISRSVIIRIFYIKLILSKRKGRSVNMSINNSNDVKVLKLSFFIWIVLIIETLKLMLLRVIYMFISFSKHPGATE